MPSSKASMMEKSFRELTLPVGVKAVTGKDAPFILLAQEIEPPSACSFHACSPALLEIADAMVEEAIDTWAKCLKADRWPGYESRIHYHEPNAWQMTQHEERINGIPYDIEKFWKENRA